MAFDKFGNAARLISKGTLEDGPFADEWNANCLFFYGTPSVHETRVGWLAGLRETREHTETFHNNFPI